MVCRGLVVTTWCKSESARGSPNAVTPAKLTNAVTLLCSFSFQRGEYKHIKVTLHHLFYIGKLLLCLCLGYISPESNIGGRYFWWYMIRRYFRLWAKRFDFSPTLWQKCFLHPCDSLDRGWGFKLCWILDHNNMLLNMMQIAQFTI